MQYAIVSGQKTAPAPRLNGTCPACGKRAIAKCGSKIMWHWAHAGIRHCDPWWENETAWHRAWKECFPAEQREIVMFASDGEKHIADVRTLNGMVIEFQNSPMEPEELRSREAFYSKIVWIVNASQFARRFSIMSPVPDPNSALGRDLVFSGEQRPNRSLKPSLLAGLAFWRKSENPGHTPGIGLVEVYDADSIRNEILEQYTGHHLFHWRQPRKVWFEAKAPVFFDFGDDVLWRLRLRDSEYDVWTVRRVRKIDFLEKNGATTTALAAPSGESPLDLQVAPDELRLLWHK